MSVLSSTPNISQVELLPATQLHYHPPKDKNQDLTKLWLLCLFILPKNIWLNKQYQMLLSIVLACLSTHH
jgi:hypothetical protein